MSVPLTQSRPRLQRVSRRAVMRSATSTYADVCREDVRLASPRPGVPLVALRRAAMRCDALWRAAMRCAVPQYVAAPRNNLPVARRAKRALWPSILRPPAPATTRAASGDCDCCCAAELMNHTVNRRIKWNQ